MKTNMLDKVGTYEFLAEPFHCDFTKKLFIGHLGNHLLNAADFHATERGFGMDSLNLDNKTWVLSRLAIEMTERPKEYARFNVETWIEGAMKYFTHRKAAAFETFDMQKFLLEQEGVEARLTEKGWKVDLKRYQWKNTLEEAEAFREEFKKRGI